MLCSFSGLRQRASLLLIVNHKPSTDGTASALPLLTVDRLRRSRVDVSPADIAELDMRVRLVGKDELGVALSGVARTCIPAVHPVHEITVAVPDGKDED
jgi:hypothetical protein